MAFYFFASVTSYSSTAARRHGQPVPRPVRGLRAFMITLIVAEIGGWLVLSAGFLDKQIF